MFNPRIQVERVSDDRLSKLVWKFRFADSSIKLYQFNTLRRKTTQHGWITKESWDGYNRHNSSIKEISYIPFPENVKLEALAQVVQAIESLPVVIQ